MSGRLSRSGFAPNPKLLGRHSRPSAGFVAAVEEKQPKVLRGGLGRAHGSGESHSAGLGRDRPGTSSLASHRAPPCGALVARPQSRPKVTAAAADHALVLDTSSGPGQLPSRRAWRDRIALAALAAAAFAVSGIVNLHERLHHWADEHERWNPYQLMPVAAGAAVVTLAYLIVTRRRLRREIAIRQEREDALTQARHKIKVLAGLLAMCASCKRIRDDDHQWEPVEMYLKRHGQVSVSHGICPHCTNQLYPDYLDALRA